MKKKTPWRDPIVEEVRKRGQEYAAKFDFDLHKMGEDLRRRQKERGAPVVSLAPRPTATNPPTVPARLDGPMNQAPDDSLIEEAVRVGDHQTKEEAVIAALQEYVQARKRQEIFELAGKVDYHDDYDPKQLRDRKPQ